MEEYQQIKNEVNNQIDYDKRSLEGNKKDGYKFTYLKNQTGEFASLNTVQLFYMEGQALSGIPSPCVVFSPRCL